MVSLTDQALRNLAGNLRRLLGNILVIMHQGLYGLYNIFSDIFYGAAKLNVCKGYTNVILHNDFAIWHMIFLWYRDIFNTFCIQHIFINRARCFIVRNAHKVYGSPCYLHFYVVVIGITKLYLPGYVFKPFPIMNIGQINRYGYFGKVFNIIQTFAYLLVVKLIGFINQVLVQCQLPANI